MDAPKESGPPDVTVQHWVLESTCNVLRLLVDHIDRPGEVLTPGLRGMVESARRCHVKLTALMHESEQRWEGNFTADQWHVVCTIHEVCESIAAEEGWPADLLHSRLRSVLAALPPNHETWNTAQTEWWVRFYLGSVHGHPRGATGSAGAPSATSYTPSELAAVNRIRLDESEEIDRQLRDEAHRRGEKL